MLWEAVTGYNNYSEFGTGKDDPARKALRPFALLPVALCSYP
ncbi:MAG: hypothetical protein QOH59_2982 [Gemmatimonadales bacterium]|jgi:hypothetical protein|nr:hypothetical protein [Gemmatimonadales bacterium]